MAGSRRPPVGSRTPTSRPRRVAGKPADPSGEVEVEVENIQTTPAEAEIDAASVDLDEPAVASVVAEPEVEKPKVEKPKVEKPRKPASKAPATSSRTTLGLTVAIVLLSLLGATEAWYLWGRDDQALVSSGRPIVANELDQAAAVDAAAKAAEVAFSGSYETYDADTAAALKLVSPEFRPAFEKTKADAKAGWIAGKLVVKATVTNQGAIRASAKEAEVLLFLEMQTTKEGEALTITPYTLNVKMVHRDQGWLVADIEAA